MDTMLLARLLPLALVACIPVLTSPPGSKDEGPWVAPENSWGLCGDGPPADLVGDGYAVGDVAHDFLLMDQYGAEVSLWQFHGCPVVLDVSTMWCAPCQELAEDAQAIADDYADMGLVYLTIMPQDLRSEPPDQDELMYWSESFELYEPILSDDVGYSANVVSDGAFPAVLLIDEDGVIVEDVAIVTDEGIRAAIDARF